MSFRPIHSLIVLFLVLSAAAEDPVPTAWPEQFHALMLMNKSGSLEIVDLWYDWVNGRNFNIIQKQLGKVTYDLEWNNGTSFYYSRDASRTCRTVHFEVGILRPNWLDGAKYLGQRHVNGFLCNVWEKVEFLWYYEDVVTKRPVQWIFYTGREAHVMTFEIGAVLEDEKWQAPVYCFNKEDDKKRTLWKDESHKRFGTSFDYALLSARGSKLSPSHPILLRFLLFFHRRTLKMNGGERAEATSTDQRLKTRGRKPGKKMTKDPNKPKRPPSAFFVFLSHNVSDR